MKQVRYTSRIHVPGIIMYSSSVRVTLSSYFRYLKCTVHSLNSFWKAFLFIERILFMFHFLFHQWTHKKELCCNTACWWSSVILQERDWETDNYWGHCLWETWCQISDQAKQSLCLTTLDPEGPPQDVTLEAITSQSIKVTWKVWLLRLLWLYQVWFNINIRIHILIKGLVILYYYY